MGQVQPEDGVARLQQREVDGGVGRGARVRLHVGEAGAEERLDPVDGELLDHVDVLAAAVVALARVALGVLVGEHRALRLHDGDRREVLRGDHLQRGLLAVQLLLHRGVDLGVDLADRRVEEVGVRGGLLAHGGEAIWRGRRDPSSGSGGYDESLGQQSSGQGQVQLR